MIAVSCAFVALATGRTPAGSGWWWWNSNVLGDVVGWTGIVSAVTVGALIAGRVRCWVWWPFATAAVILSTVIAGRVAWVLMNYGGGTAVGWQTRVAVAGLWVCAWLVTLDVTERHARRVACACRR